MFTTKAGIFSPSQVDTSEWESIDGGYSSVIIYENLVRQTYRIIAKSAMTNEVCN
jgi:hypothetical protein